jgi:hypothetical protein
VPHICVRTPVGGKLSDILFWSDQYTLKGEAQLCLRLDRKSDISSRRPPVLTSRKPNHTPIFATPPKGEGAQRLNDYSHSQLEFSRAIGEMLETAPPFGATGR